MSTLPVLLVVVIAAFAAGTSTCVAADATRPSTPLLVENVTASPEAQDFIRARCNDTCVRRPVVARACYDLLLPYAGSINGSYNKASLAIITVMVSKLTDLAKDLRGYGEAGRLEGCIKVLDEAIAGAKETMPKLDRISTIADDKLDAKDPDLILVWNWLYSLDNNFTKCWDGGLKRVMDRVPSSDAADYSEFAAAAIFFKPRPNWSLPSPDGSKR
ncbi:unnamed protein product [Urochloa decumbens]|uniref:Pectinesterase inhibitor domain-containing protein n=1 Tax=Urochloa decumbens TaxID=240449 RepID=A0ABC8W492_9POAL